VHVLPDHYKQLGNVSVNRVVDLMQRRQFSPGKITQLTNTRLWSTYESYWERLKDEFKQEINRVDLIRGEDFRKTFPELAPLMDL
jgi:hypothetical protein